MDAIYPRYAVARSVFYDDPGLRVIETAERYRLDDAVDWTDWDSRDDGHWSFWRPHGTTVIEQGWKIHVSTVLDDAHHVLRKVSSYCHRRELAFKHLPHREALRATDSKDADRSSSGKFITIYPADENELHDALVDLDGLVGGMPGPYVLSDLRWNAGPLSVRYGAFIAQSVRRDGVQVPALRDPRTGDLVEDVRTTAFVPPAWVTLPPFLQAQVDTLGDGQPPAGFPVVTAALHHSNAGGVYEAEDGGERVVLKEARPAAGFTPDGRDAVTRLRHEETVLRRIRLPQTVAVRRSFHKHGHHFLVLERVDGQALNKEVVSRNPRVRAGSTANDRRVYRDWALAIARQLREAVSRLHETGYSHGDLHPGNVIVRPDGRITLLDFEMAQPLVDEVAPVVGAPGFVPADMRGGARHDLYALACIEVFLFLPLTTIMPLDPRKADDLLRAAEHEFELPADWITTVAADLAIAPPDPGSESHGARRADQAIRRFELDTVTALGPAIEATAAQLSADAEFDRRDRAWPGDPIQFVERGYGLAHGASGVMASLATAHTVGDPRASTWLDEALTRDGGSPAAGLYDGLAGVVWALRRIGDHERADRSLARLRETNLDQLGDDLYGGLPGVGLTLLAESDSDSTLLPIVFDIARRVREQYEARTRPTESRVATGSGGLLRGRSGTALFALHLYERTGDREHLRLAERAMDDDLVSLLRADDESLQVDEGWRILPYLGSGSTGIGSVLAQLVEHTADTGRYLEALDGIRRAATARFTIQSGLFNGRAGLVHFLLILARRGLSTPESDAALARHVRELRLHGIRRPDGLGFPGDGLLRLSCDLATGSAGVLTALTAYRAFLSGEEPANTGLPFLTPPAASTRAWPPLAGHTIERG